MTRFERWSVWVTSLLTTVTGLVYLWMKYGLESGEPWSVVNHPLQPLILKLHIVTAPLLVFAIGLITLRHVWRHFQNRIRSGRRSGVVMALVIGPMILTGYLIQAVTHEGWLTALAWSHIGFGLVYAVLLIVHQVMLRRDRPADVWSARPGGRTTAAFRPPADGKAPLRAVVARRRRGPEPTRARDRGVG